MIISRYNTLLNVTIRYNTIQIWIVSIQVTQIVRDKILIYQKPLNPLKTLELLAVRQMTIVDSGVTLCVSYESSPDHECKDLGLFSYVYLVA